MRKNPFAVVLFSLGVGLMLIGVTGLIVTDADPNSSLRDFIISVAFVLAGSAHLSAFLACAAVILNQRGNS